MANSAYIRYLLTLNRLHKAEGIRSVDVSHELDVTKTSVHKMMEIFVELNYVKKERGGLIFLTDLGLQEARSYQEQYDVARERLFGDALTDNSAEKAICALIADLSEESSRLLMREHAAPKIFALH